MNSSLAFVFPGQGSQKIGMLADLAAEYPIIKETLQEGSDALGTDLVAMIYDGDQETLNLTENTQPALLASSIALWRLWQKQGGVEPARLAGHSLGEFSALVAAGSLDFGDALRLVKKRGQAMQTAVPVGEGAMAAVLGLDDDKIEDICKQLADTGVVEAVNYNSPGQVVIAGHTAAVAKAIELLKEAGAKRAMELPVSAPFHTSLMEPAGLKLQEALAELDVAAPKIPVIHNVHAQAENNPDAIKDLLVKQISSPVKWTSCVQAMVSDGTEICVECGPGRVLGGLVRRIHKSLTAYATDDPDAFNKALEGVNA